MSKTTSGDRPDPRLVHQIIAGMSRDGKSLAEKMIATRREQWCAEDDDFCSEPSRIAYALSEGDARDRVLAAEKVVCVSLARIDEDPEWPDAALRSLVDEVAMTRLRDLVIKVLPLASEVEAFWRKAVGAYGRSGRKKMGIARSAPSRRRPARKAHTEYLIEDLLSAFQAAESGLDASGYATVVLPKLAKLARIETHPVPEAVPTLRRAIQRWIYEELVKSATQANGRCEADMSAKGSLASDAKINTTLHPKRTGDDDAWLTPRDVAQRYRNLTFEAVASRLRRFRERSGEGWTEVTEPKPREARYLYQFGTIKHLF